MSAFMDAKLLSVHLQGVLRRVENAMDAGTLTDHEFARVMDYVQDRRDELEILAEVGQIEREEWAAARDDRLLREVLDDVADLTGSDSAEELHATWFRGKSMSTCSCYVCQARRRGIRAPGICPRGNPTPLTRKSSTSADDDVYSQLSAAELEVVSSYRGYLAEQR